MTTPTFTLPRPRAISPWGRYADSTNTGPDLREHAKQGVWGYPYRCEDFTLKPVCRQIYSPTRPA